MGWSRTRIIASVATAVVALPATAHAERLVYLNLDATALNGDNGQDPTTNSYTSGGFTPGPIAGWPTLSQAQRDLLLFWLKKATAPFDVVFTFDRPAAAPYDMVVFGTAADNAALFATTGCSAAIGLSDCEDAQGPNISFMFYGCLAAGQEDDMRRVAFNTLVATGFSWGLENENSNGQIMGSYSVFGLEFGDACVATNNGTCTHASCGAGMQNAAIDVTAVAGARVDDGPPTVEIVTPLDLSDVGESFSVVAEVNDKYGGVSVTLEIVEAGQMIAQPEPPYTWSLSGVPAGAWTIRVTATDADANVTTQEVVVCVDVEDCPNGPSTGGSSSGSGESGEGTTSTTGEPDPSTSGPETTTSATSANESTGEPPTTGSGAPLDPTTPLDPAGFGATGTGCNCSTPQGGTNGSGAGFGGLAVLMLLALRRRSPAVRIR